MGVEQSNPLILAGIGDVLVGIVDGSIGMAAHANLRIKICDVVMDFFVKAPLKTSEDFDESNQLLRVSPKPIGKHMTHLQGMALASMDGRVL
jgi:hypothetical protein